MKNAKMTIVAVLVALVAVTTYSVSGTYAKYTDTFEGTSDSARVAKWAIELTDLESNTLSKTFTFDLFKALKEADGTTAETDVSSSDVVIAPGTGGKVDLKLANKSEVNAQYKVEYTVTNAANIPVEFLVDGNWVTGLPNAESTFAAIASGAEDTISIQWRWAFEGKDSENYQTSQTDTTDTELGTAGTATIQVEAKVIVEQVD